MGSIANERDTRFWISFHANREHEQRAWIQAVFVL
jgi:hypothetical protein